MTGFDSDLWARLEAHTIGPADASLTFAQRLARENRWSQGHAERVILEYKRFCYLARTAKVGQQVTPSDAVDQAWHLHLTYSRDYWEDFCPNVLGAALHHGPTAGGQVERTRYYEQYAATLSAYEAVFGFPPPAEVWPDAKRRFQIDPQGVRVNPRDVMIMPRAKLVAVIGITAVLAGIAGWLIGGVL